MLKYWLLCKYVNDKDPTRINFNKCKSTLNIDLYSAKSIHNPRPKLRQEIRELLSYSSYHVT